MRTRTIISVIIILLFILFELSYPVIKHSIETEIAVQQLQDSAIVYSIIQQVIMSNVIEFGVFVIYVFLLFCIWIGPIVRYLKKRSCYSD